MVSKTRARSYKSPNAALVPLKESKTKKSRRDEKKLPSPSGKGENATRKEAKITTAASVQEDKQSPTREAEISRTFLSPQANIASERSESTGWFMRKLTIAKLR